MKIDTTQDLSKYKNSSDWKVEHDGDTSLYSVRNKKGQTLPGKFTTRAFAMNALEEYLEKLQKTAGPGRGGLKTKIDDNS